MLDFDTLDGVKKAIRVRDVRAANRAPNFAFMVPFVFTALAAGGNVNVPFKNTASGALVVAANVGVLHDGAGAAITASELVTVNFTANEGPWQQEAIPWDCCVGTASQPFFWLFRPVIAPGANMVVKITNGTAASTITGSLVMVGHILGV